MTISTMTVVPRFTMTMTTTESLTEIYDRLKIKRGTNMAWGAQTNQKPWKGHREDGTWGAQTKKVPDDKGTEDERDIDEGKIWTGTKKKGWRS